MTIGPEKILFQNVHKDFQSTGKVLRDLNFTAESGDFVVLLGRSGAGKSTLLRLIAGLEEPTQGNLKINLNSANDRGFVFQEPHLMPWRNLIENVGLPLELIGLPQNEISKRAEAALDQVQLSGVSHLKPSELSGGMKMRASLARALVAEPSLLLLDEPFAALDEQTRFKLSEDLRNLWCEKRITVVFVTHSVQEACFLGNRILILSEKPSVIKHDIKINLPERRKTQLRTDPVFNNELKKIYELIGSSGSEGSG